MLADVLLLTRITGERVLGNDGRPIGRLKDLSVRLSAEQPEVQRFVVAVGKTRTLAVPTSAVVIRHGQLALTGAGSPARFEVPAVSDVLAPDEILLKRDVLDTQIVDVVGQRLARVSEVLLGRTPTGRLAALGVEVGPAGVLRRLGLGGAKAGTDIVAWGDLHLTSQRGHRVQLDVPRAAIHRLDPRGLAGLVSRLGTDSATQVLAREEPTVAANAIRAAHPEVGERVLRAMPDAAATRIVAAMPPEPATRWRHRLAHTPVWPGRWLLRSRVLARRHLNGVRR